MTHIAAATQIRLDTDGRASYLRKIAAGKTRREAMRCLKRRISDALHRQLQPPRRRPAWAASRRARSKSLRKSWLVATGQSAGIMCDVGQLVTLYVNDYNAPARAAYRRVGFVEAGRFMTVLL